MVHFRRLLSLVAVVAAVSAGSISQRNGIVVRSNGTAANDPNAPSPPQSDGPDLSSANPTDSDTIASTAQQVDQKTGPTDSSPPSDSVPPTVVTAVDGDVTAAGQSGDSLLNVLQDPTSHPTLDTGSTVSKRELSLQRRSTYDQVFDGTGTDPDDRDASIQGTAYLTFETLPTYDVGACEAFCDGISGCVFVNLFYHFNSDPVVNPQIKCAAYGDIHTAAEKTNFGGQQLLPLPAGKTYVQQSTGYAVDSLDDPLVPDGYKLVFGPTNGANQAPGYMGFAFLDKYDVQACANLCNTRGPDGVGGACQFFNIWRALYYLPTDAPTATNTGQGNLQVTYSRGYQRISILPDGGFEDYLACDVFCYTTSDDEDPNWFTISPPGGSGDAEIFYNPSYARTGHGVACLGSGYGSDTYSGTLQPKLPLNTVAGKDYWITFFHQDWWSAQSTSPFVDVYWNDVQVLLINTPFEKWTYYQVKVTAVGNDVLKFYGGTYPSYDFIDDIYIFLAN
ncbi:hypothetical protein BDN72DRAFT_836916 [Pluteus cervinus]|uniref:Uncharacterized protein n=1 Tax=Pluteus cervinus TaxID=181527 RepID=A0ACD3B268_9AGAR|nr:hypothetical protein BDN72DRAFT_836916 [Pluteus cervinus]